MADIFAIRNVDGATRTFVIRYAEEHNITIAEALREIVMLVQAHMGEKTSKKYKSVFDVLDKLKFKTPDPKLSEHIDDIVYGD